MSLGTRLASRMLARFTMDMMEGGISKKDLATAMEAAVLSLRGNSEAMQMASAMADGEEFTADQVNGALRNIGRRLGAGSDVTPTVLTVPSNMSQEEFEARLREAFGPGAMVINAADLPDGNECDCRECTARRARVAEQKERYAEALKPGLADPGSPWKEPTE